ncbi:hypothetical protein AMTRI_Chr02g219680 [Amborella trichopoda]
MLFNIRCCFFVFYFLRQSLQEREETPNMELLINANLEFYNKSTMTNVQFFVQFHKFPMITSLTSSLIAIENNSTLTSKKNMDVGAFPLLQWVKTNIFTHTAKKDNKQTNHPQRELEPCSRYINELVDFLISLNVLEVLN